MTCGQSDGTGGGGVADKHTHKVARSCCVGAVSSPLCPSCKPCFPACRVDDAQRDHVGCTAAQRRRTDRTSVTKPVSNAQARIVTLKRQDPFICREKASVPSLAHVWVSFLRGNHRTSSPPSLCPTADGVTFIRDVVYQDRNISTQAISLPNEQAAQTTLYFRKLPLGSTGRTTMENLIYLRPFDVFFSLFFVAPALWRAECEFRGGSATQRGTLDWKVPRRFPHAWPRHCSPSSLSIVILPLGINPFLLNKLCLVLPGPVPAWQ